jgi:hypothetical protein
VLNVGLSPGWALLFTAVQIEGAVRYSYTFDAGESGYGPDGEDAGASIMAIGDLDGDNASSTVTLTCVRTSGVYQCDQVPSPGEEDSTTF